MKRQASIQSFLSQKRQKTDDESSNSLPTSDLVSSQSAPVNKDSLDVGQSTCINTCTNDVSHLIGRQIPDDEKLSLYVKGFSIQKDYKFPYTKISGKNRSFQKSWMEKYPGLVYSQQEDGAYCLHCVLFEHEPSSRGKLVNGPFKNWKNAIEAFEEHFFGKGPKTLKKGGCGYQRHLQCVTKGDMFRQQMAQNTNVRLLLNNGLKDRQEKNMKVLESIVKTVLFCAKQNIALRGHRDDTKHIEDDTTCMNTGNFQALLDFRIDSGDSVLNEHFRTAPKNATYRSKTIQNEIIEVIASLIRDKITEDIIESGGMYSVSADEVRDISNKEQLAVCLRFVDTKGSIREEFIEFIEVSDDTSGERISKELLELIPKVGLDLNKMRSQCYDGAGRAVDVIKALGSVTLVKEALQDARDNINVFHQKWYSEVQQMAEKLEVPPSKPRTCGRQTQRGNVPSESVADYFKKTISIPLLDHILTEMNGRFGDLQIKASMGLHVIPSLVGSAAETSFDFFIDDLPSPGTLSQELHMWRLKWNKSSDAPSDVQGALAYCDKSMFPNIHTILKICGIFPVTSCECERSISVLRLVKTYLRSTMTTTRASSLVLIYCHRNMDLCPKEIVRRFALKHPRRMVLPDILSEQ